MNRREFLRALGIGAGALAIDPSQIPSAFPAVADVFTGYPPPHFTGFKQSMSSTMLAGQFLWGVLWEAEGRIDVTHWYTSCQLGLWDLDGPDAVAVFKTKLHNAVLSTMMYMDGIVSDVNQKLVEVIVTEPNPAYDPDHAKNHELEDDEYCINCRTHHSIPRKRSVDRAKLISYQDLYRVHDESADKLWTVEYPPTINTVNIENQAIASLLAMGIKLPCNGC